MRRFVAAAALVVFATACSTPRQAGRTATIIGGGIALLGFLPLADPHDENAGYAVILVAVPGLAIMTIGALVWLFSYYEGDSEQQEPGKAVVPMDPDCRERRAVVLRRVQASNDPKERAEILRELPTCAPK